MKQCKYHSHYCNFKHFIKEGKEYICTNHYTDRVFHPENYEKDEIKSEIKIRDTQDTR